MKKLILISLGLIFSFFSYAQENRDIDIGLGGAFYSIDTKNSLHYGVEFSLGVRNIHIDFSSNLAQGDGKLLGYQQMKYPPNKLRVFLINTGYKFPIGKYFKICPTIGYGWTRNLYVNPIGFKDYYKGKIINYTNVGVIAYIDIQDYTNIYIGVGTYEKFKIGLTYTINQGSYGCL